MSDVSKKESILWAPMKMEVGIFLIPLLCWRNKGEQVYNILLYVFTQLEFGREYAKKS